MPQEPRPFDAVVDYFRELDRMRQTGLHGRDVGGHDQPPGPASAWVPATDVLVRGDDLVVVIDLPGVGADEVDLRFRHGVLTVSGSRQTGTDDASYSVRERAAGPFRRSVPLPEGTEPSQITAVFDEGLVEITVAGAATQTDEDRIEVRTGPSRERRRALD